MYECILLYEGGQYERPIIGRHFLVLLAQNARVRHDWAGLHSTTALRTDGNSGQTLR